MFSPRGNIGLKKLITKKGNSIYLLTYLDVGGGALHPIESSREGNIGWGGGTSTPCMSSVQDLPKNQLSVESNDLLKMAI